MSKFKEGRDYQIVQHPTDEATGAVHVTRGAFKDLVYSYGQVEFREDESCEVDECTLKFRYEVHDIPKPYTEETLRVDPSFNDMMGEILVVIMEESCQKIK